MKELELPKAAVLQRALRSTTDRLAAELATPLPIAPAWNDFEWRAAMAVSVMHGISGLLASRLMWGGPPHWQAFLAEQAEQGRRREARVRELLARLHVSAMAAGLPLLALKGSALLELGVYAPGQRPMSDVDLLARPGDLQAADRLITLSGYSAGAVKNRHIAYEPPPLRDTPAFGEHEDNPIKIELHGAVREPLPRRQIDITAGLLPAAPRPGLNAYASRAVLMRHLLLHTAGNLCSRSVRLIQLHDIAALGARLNTAEWKQALAPASDGRDAWWAVAPLTLAQQLFPGELPPIPAAARAACPAWLRRASSGYRLADVSLSRLGVPLLPGLEWSRDPIDALGLAWQRLHPQEQRQVVQRQPSLAASAWTQRPHWRKALSFLRGAPPRAQTLYSLHRALAYRPTSSA